MNRFRTRKKSQGETSREGSRRPSYDNDVSPLPSFASRTFKRKKNTPPEPKPEVDLSTALPTSDEFRTSLLMPKLSARFSMLKEQDDPTSKIGKANDDSVLFPKRASRLDLFSNRPGLSDIAEVGSLRGSVRPPFASTRTESYGSDGYATDDGSIMSRSRPGEGNIMFGGRQKIYKIPVGGAGSVKNFDGQADSDLSCGAPMGGKPIYESDITTSTFQRLREQEKQEHERASHEPNNVRPSKEHDRSGSPPYVRYNRNRETTSSTNSAPSQSRVSTAATSVASQKSTYGMHENTNGPTHVPPQLSSSTSDRSIGKSRRLYGQGLDRDLHEQQASSLQRLGSFSRTRTPVGGPVISPLHQSQSASNLNERYQRGMPSYPPNDFRTESPVPPAASPRLADFDLGLNAELHNHNPGNSGYGRSPPLSPPVSPDVESSNPDPTLLASLEPDDIGKATALGAFNKPKRQYDESQYLQRQIQLQEGRGTPSPQPFRSFSPQALSLNEQATAGRSRNNSSGSSISRTNSFRYPWMEDRLPRPVTERGPLRTLQTNSEDRTQSAMEQSFFSGINSGEVSSAPESESDGDPTPPTDPSTRFQGFEQCSRPTNSRRPLNSNLEPAHQIESIDVIPPEMRNHKNENPIIRYQEPHLPKKENDQFHANSPTLGPVGASNGLNGLVRAHLRNDSGHSSIHPDDSPRRSRKVEIRESILGYESALSHQDSTNDGPHTANGLDQSMPPLSSTARNILKQATTLRNLESPKAKQMLGNDKAQQVLGGEAPRSGHGSGPSWQEQLSVYHTRGASTETQKERDELAQELAERRKIVQDNLQGLVELESRSASSASSARTQDGSPAKPANTFEIIKKTSRGSLAARQEKPSKAMKMLGMDHDSGANQPASTLFLTREQLPDRSMPPRSMGPMRPTKFQDMPQDPGHNFMLGFDAENSKGSHRVSASKKKSAKLSNASSTYSETSDHTDFLQKGSAAKMGTESNQNRIQKPPAMVNVSASQNVNDSSTVEVQSMLHFNRSAPSSRDGSQPTMSGPPRGDSKASTLLPFEQRTAPPGTPYMISPTTHSTPPTSSHSNLSLRQNPTLPAVNQPTVTSPRNSPTRRNFTRSGQGRKHSISKHDISEPTFISCTSSVDTVDLPPGASLKNGMDEPPSPTVAPPIPNRNSRRKRTQTLRHALGKLEKAEPVSPIPSPSDNQTSHHGRQEERSTFSDDEPDPNPRRRLKKTSGEGGTINSKTQAQAAHTSNAAVLPNLSSQNPVPTVNHVRYQAQTDIPASAVMF